MTAISFDSDTSLIQAPVTGEKLHESFKSVYEKHPAEDSHWTARLVSRISVIVTSCLGSVTFVPVSLPLGKISGPVGAAGNWLTFLVVDYWSAKGMINAAFGPKTPAEVELNSITRNTNTCKNVALFSSAFLIALLAQVPHALAAMEYNEEKYKIAAGIVLLVSGAILPLRSLQLSLEQIALKAQSSEESKVTELKKKMGGLLGACHEAFIKKSPEEKAAFIRRLPVDDTDTRTLALIQEENAPPVGCIETAFNYTGLGLGTALAALYEYASAEYAFVQTKKQVCDNNGVGGVFAALAVASTAYLIGLSIITTTQRVFNVCGNAIAGNETRNLSWQLRPKLSAALSAIGLLINTAALGPNYVIWGDFYTKKVEHELFQNGVCAALFLLFFTSSLDIIDDVVVSSLANGTEEEKEILEVSEEFKKLEALVQACPNDEFVAYLNGSGSAPRALRAKLKDDDRSLSPMRERSPFTD